MSAWWQTLTPLEHVLLYIAVPATLVLVVQTLLLFFSGDMDSEGGLDGGAEVDLDGDGVPDAVLPDPDGCGDPLSHLDADDADPQDAPPGQGLHILTVRGVVVFLTLFGWGALWLCQIGLPDWLALFLAVPIGLAGMIGVAFILQQAMRLQYDGTLDLRNALGREATVYLTVPASRSGTGKVNLIIQDQLRELDAVTDEAAPLPTGSQVVVEALSGGESLVVRRK